MEKKQTMSPSLKLLVIDDDDIDRMQLKRALATSGFKYEIQEYSVIDNNADFNSFRNFDCIFLDYLLPGDNGLLLIKKIRDLGVKTPVVIITSQGNESIAVELMKAGASDYVVKNDINSQSLSKLLRNVLAMRTVVEEREMAEQALRTSESRLAEAQSIAKIGNWEFDVDANSFYCSDEVYKIAGLPKEFELTLENLFGCLHSEDREKGDVAWQEILNGKPINLDFRLNTPQGVKFANSQGYAIADNTGRIVKIIGTIQDITERKLGEEEISEARELAENSVKVREVFLANMSHEIRTPMNAILGFTDLLYDTNLSSEQKRFVDAIHFSGENLLVVINDILDLSKIRSGKMSIEKNDFNLEEVTTSILSVLAPRAKEKGLELTCTIDSHIPPVIKGDAVRLNQVLTNLISNAIKFTQEGAVMLTINSSTSENQDVLIEFSVSDTGIGIQEDKHSAIFDNFVQASNDTTRKYGGSGLGLTIVKSLVELQDGKISLRSQPGMGSTFQVHLPFEKSSHAVSERTAQVFPQGEMLENLRDIVVLVVEDNAVNQLLARKVLEKVGCEIDMASNGKEALTCIRSKQYDIVLMDLQMPEMDGYEATRQIRKDPSKSLSEIPIIAMTAHAFGSDVTRCMSAGMNDYISKPFKANDLYAKIMKYVAKKKETKVVPLHPGDDNYRIDLSTIHQIGQEDAEFVSDLILIYERQTPAFIEKLRAFVKTHNYTAVRAICHQIRSSYGILKMPALDNVLGEISMALDSQKPGSRFMKIGSLVETVISLITVMNEEVQRGLRKTGTI